MVLREKTNHCFHVLAPGVFESWPGIRLLEKTRFHTSYSWEGGCAGVYVGDSADVLDRAFDGKREGIVFIFLQECFR